MSDNEIVLQSRIDRLIIEVAQLRRLNDIQAARLKEQDEELDLLEKESQRLERRCEELKLEIH